MAENKNGYIHILTNPSLEDDWSKFVVCDYPVVSKSELRNNESIPLPYYPYATLKIDNFKNAVNLFSSVKEVVNDGCYHVYNDCFMNASPDRALNLFYAHANILNLKMEISVFDKNDEDLVHILEYNHGIQYLFSFYDEEELDPEELYEDSSSGYYGGWSNSELRDACDAAYEGHSRLELGLE